MSIYDYPISRSILSEIYGEQIANNFTSHPTDFDKSIITYFNQFGTLDPWTVRHHNLLAEDIINCKYPKEEMFVIINSLKPDLRGYYTKVFEYYERLNNDHQKNPTVQHIYSDIEQLLYECRSLHNITHINVNGIQTPWTYEDHHFGCIFVRTFKTKNEFDERNKNYKWGTQQMHLKIYEYCHRNSIIDY